MLLEDEEIERLMARKKAIQATLAAQARNPAPSHGGGCSSGGCSSSAAAAPRKALPQTGAGGTPRAVLVLTLLRAAGLAVAAGVGLWALVQAL